MGIQAAARPAQEAATVDWSSVCYSNRDMVFEAGSSAEGFDRHKSDLDVYLIYDKSAPGAANLPHTPPEYHPVIKISASGQLYDVELFPLQWMEDLAERLNGLPLDDWDALCDFPMEDLNTYYRTSIGRPLWNIPRFKELQSRFSKEKLAKVFAIWCGMHGARKLQSAERLRDHGDLDGAFMAARDAVMFAVDGHLARNGEAFTGRKFRYSKLQRFGGRGSELYRRTWELKTLGEKPLEKYIEEAAAFCQSLGLTNYRGKERPHNPAPAADVALFRVGLEHFFVKNKTIIYQTDAIGAALWSALDGKTPLGVIADRLAGDGVLAPDTAPAYCKSFVELCIAAGVCEKRYAPRH
jgi:hypothetical protein